MCYFHDRRTIIRRQGNLVLHSVLIMIQSESLYAGNCMLTSQFSISCHSIPCCPTDLYIAKSLVFVDIYHA